MCFDDAGNNTVVNADGTLTTYTWDGENRLQVIELPTADVMTLTYDATGLRRKRQDASGTTDFVWDLENLLMEVSGATTQAQYTVNSLSRGVGEARGEGSYGPVLSQRRGGTSHFLLADAIGTTTRLLDPSESVTDTYVMDAFGDPVATSGSSVNPFRYVGGQGYYHEADASLNYVRARWLRPTTGSWLSVDPVEGEARYVYVGGRPVLTTDPAGEEPFRLDPTAGEWASVTGYFNWLFPPSDDLFPPKPPKPPKPVDGSGPIWPYPPVGGTYPPYIIEDMCHAAAEEGRPCLFPYPAECWPGWPEQMCFGGFDHWAIGYPWISPNPPSYPPGWGPGMATLPGLALPSVLYPPYQSYGTPITPVGPGPGAGSGHHPPGPSERERGRGFVETSEGFAPPWASPSPHVNPDAIYYPSRPETWK
jgi:RHS repeat-associated protein